MPLREIIIDKIKKEGPVSFRDFMEMALYYPGAGYYANERDPVGGSGDYYTSPYITSAFGALVAKQLEEMWELLGKRKFTVVEYGAGNGCLCRDIMQHLKKNEALYSGLRYCIIEKSPFMKRKQKIGSDEKVYWFNSITDIPALEGCILSNEVVDNFAVHQVLMQNELMEVFVDYKDGFTECLRPASPKLKHYLLQSAVQLMPGFRTEINLRATEWIGQIARTLQKGFVLTIDYGYPVSELYHPLRTSGTLLCYYKHQINDCPYIHIGEQDITAHVNFSALVQWGLKGGLQYGGFTSQAYFLLGLGLTRQLEKMEKNAGSSIGALHEEKVRFLHNFLLGMGKKIKVLLQQKGLQKPCFSGFQFSSPVL
ncbi:SAM-dependent methyltransferase [Agriterribacter sp.]|uniref:class I SAM-dependent methyltransferase n=1 Tax=Agriterribacter sp. TaxID=2821509 RepID=UPI002D12C5F7|nr:SAM-dependent methyltransferase [Agriterribacter sp.]HRP55344.1 SAM-dependent methyltransferase [Agriterribacter sp.]